MSNVNAKVNLRDVGQIAEQKFVNLPRIHETIHVPTANEFLTLIVTDVNHFGVSVEDNGSPFVILETEIFDETKHAPNH